MMAKRIEHLHAGFAFAAANASDAPRRAREA